MKRTKIVCTIGPATEDGEILKQMVKAGMNVARINFPHGGIEEQWKYIEAVKKAREEGLKQGIEQGIAQGIAQGVEQTKKEMVINMYNKKYNLEDISDIANLRIEDIKNIVDNI